MPPHLRHDGRFPPEPLDVGVGRLLAGDHDFQRDIAPQLGIERAVDDSHPAAPQLPQHPVRPDLVGRLIVKHFGLDPDKDVKWAVAGSDEGRYIRMQQGLLDATMATVPTDYLGRKMGFPVIVRSEDLFTYPFSGITASIKKIKEKPDEVKRVIRAGIKANRYMRANRDGTIPVLMSTYRIDKEVASAAYDSFIKGFNNDGSMPEDGFRRLLDDTKRLMKIDREIALSEVADLSILREAQRELGIK